MKTLSELQKLTDSQLLDYYRANPTRWVKCTIPARKLERIVRCTKLINADENVSNISRLSYCPSKRLSEGVFNRCSFPKQEMFYGTIYGRDGDEIIEALMTSIIEVSDLCHYTTYQEEYYVSGEWIVKKDLVTILIYDSSSIAKNSFFKEADYLPQQYIAQHLDETFGDPAIIEAFSHEVKNNSDYRISASYSNFLFSFSSIDAIIYPSVRTSQFGTCIAIRPSFVDSGGLELVATSKYKLYLDGEKSVRAVAYQHGYVDCETNRVRYESITL
ncbi:MAG: hypothetical protein J5490_02585 [Bacteroidales bacterium]|nr:hypothetical protein [Bacteroidales bacterium]